MTTENFLMRLQGVRSRGPGRWFSICPSHEEKTGSLSIRELDGRILLHDFGGCSPREIVVAIGLELRDLFIDDLPRGSRPAPKPPHVDRRRMAFDLELHGNCLMERAQACLGAISNTNVAEWSDADLDGALNKIATAYHDRERAQLLFDVADGLRVRAYQERCR